MDNADKIRKIFARQLLSIKPSDNEIAKVKQLVLEFGALLNLELKKPRIKAEVFVGGSLAKNTIIKKKEKYDIDFFVRFDYSKYSGKSSELSEILAKPVERLAKKLKIRIEKIHGSRDYFNLSYKAIFLEIIPILKIKKASEAKNITDISPLHVSYVVNKLAKRRKLADEIRLAKTFCYVQGCYGAESYIKGFSGYSLEALCIYFGSFLNFLKGAAQWSLAKKIIIDSAKHYKNKNCILTLLNESKLQSPLILIDPVQKERNVTAAISSETFENFLKSVNEFLKKPSDEFFKIKIDVSEDLRKKAKARKAQFNAFAIESSSDKLDIAGAKSLRISKFILNLMKKYGFAVLDSKFVFDVVMKKGFFYVVCKNPSARTELSGPPVGLEKYVAEFKKKYKKTSVKNGKIIAIVKTKVRNAKELLKELAGYKRELKEMQIKRVYLY